MRQITQALVFCVLVGVALTNSSFPTTEAEQSAYTRSYLQKLLKSSKPSLKDELVSFPSLNGQSCSPELMTLFLRRNKYPYEVHTVTTEDGYILTLFRIQAQNSGKIDPTKPPVIFQHGILDAADGWIINGDKGSLLLNLANNGLDVWAANSRGNKFSRNHEHLSPEDNEFWDFSFQEMAQFDVPANVRYVLAQTKFERLSYVGHSQGTTSMFAGLSDPATSEFLNSKIIRFHALAPVANLAHMGPYFLNVLGKASFILNIGAKMGINELLPGTCSSTPVSAYLLSKFCSMTTLCTRLIFCDLDPSVDNNDSMGSFIEHYPSGASFRSLLHFSQLLSDTDLRKYDFGKYQNIVRYGQEQPPMYDLSKITTKLNMYVGSKDTLGDITDNMRLPAKLPNLSNFEIKVLENWGHATFMIGKDAEFVYDGVSHAILRDMKGMKPQSE